MLTRCWMLIEEGKSSINGQYWRPLKLEESWIRARLKPLTCWWCRQAWPRRGRGWPGRGWSGGKVLAPGKKGDQQDGRLSAGMEGQEMLLKIDLEIEVRSMFETLGKSWWRLQSWLAQRLGWRESGDEEGEASEAPLEGSGFVQSRSGNDLRRRGSGSPPTAGRTLRSWFANWNNESGEDEKPRQAVLSVVSWLTWTLACNWRSTTWQRRKIHQMLKMNICMFFIF